MIQETEMNNFHFSTHKISSNYSNLYKILTFQTEHSI